MRNALTIALLAVLALLPGRGHAAEAELYKGKTITIMCGYGVGGGYDVYARLLARHLPNHLAGQPTIIVQNMPGAGGMRAANTVYATAPKDGTVIAAVNPSLLMYQLMGGQSARYETSKLQWIGSLDEPNNSIIAWHTSGIRSIDDAKAREVPVPGDGPTSAMTIYPTVANALLGTRFKVIDGYSGSAAGDLALERGEVDARSGANLTSVFSRHSDWIRDGKIAFLLQVGGKRDSALADVPLLQELVKSEHERQVAAVVSLPTTVGPGYWLAPGVPDDALRALRTAFDAMIADPQFLADAQKSNLQIRAKSGAQVQATVSAVAQIPQTVMTETAAILKW